jgi:hypothetical protein
MIPRSVKTHKSIHRAGIKMNKIPCIHTFFSTYQNKKIQKILDKHPAKIRPIRNISKPQRTTNLRMTDTNPSILIRSTSFGVLVDIFQDVHIIKSKFT